MIYACLVWSNLIRKSNCNVLQIQKNKFLRIIGNYPRHTKITKIHQELNIETIENYVIYLRITMPILRIIKIH